jgi:biotin carboxyl carrier protein
MQRKFRITVDGRQHDVTVEELTYPSSVPYVTRDAPFIPSSPSNPPSTPHAAVGSKAITHSSAGADEVVCTLGGMVESVLVTPGQQISVGDHLVVIEAMKMKTPIAAPRAGKVGSILVKAGESVETGQVLVELTPA